MNSGWSARTIGAAQKEWAVRLGLVLGLVVSPLGGCGSDDTKDATTADATGNDGTSQDGTAQDGTAADGTGADASDKVNTLVADGEYLMGIKLSLGGAQLVAKAVITAEGEAGKGGKILTIDVYGANSDGWVDTTPFASAKDIAVAADGTFKVDAGAVTVPALASPTGTPVPATLIFIGQIVPEGGFCGAIEGEVPDFKADLKGSTFRAVTWPDKVPKDYAVTCPGATGKVYEPIKTCPTLKGGNNAMTSATFDRNFDLYLPEGATATTGDTKFPVVVLYHGNTGNAQGILDETGWKAAADGKAILIVPNTTASVDGSKPVLDWRFAEKVFDMDNRELVFFDDMLGCVGKQFAVDAKRVYVTGMSAGGLMSTFLAANRSEVIAAAAPLSGGYLHDWPDAKRKVPFLYTWGGDKDEAYSQDFHKLALAILAVFDAKGYLHADCNHGTGHKIPVGFSTHQWNWLSKFTLDTKGDPHEGKLPEGFPSWCTPAKAPK